MPVAADGLTLISSIPEIAADRPPLHPENRHRQNRRYWVKDTGQCIVLLFKGRIMRFTEYLNPRGTRVRMHADARRHLPLHILFPGQPRPAAAAFQLVSHFLSILPYPDKDPTVACPADPRNVGNAGELLANSGQ